MADVISSLISVLENRRDEHIRALWEYAMTADAIADTSSNPTAVYFVKAQCLGELRRMKCLWVLNADTNPAGILLRVACRSRQTTILLHLFEQDIQADLAPIVSKLLKQHQSVGAGEKK